jgi:hypothetical protein
VTPNLNNYTWYNFTAQAATLTINAAINGNEGQSLTFKIKDNGTAQTLSWNSNQRGP